MGAIRPRSVRYLGEHNRKPKPFIWTADPNRIIEKLCRACQNVGIKPLGSGLVNARKPVMWVTVFPS
jgi:hypothetical protein